MISRTHIPVQICNLSLYLSLEFRTPIDNADTLPFTLHDCLQLVLVGDPAFPLAGDGVLDGVPPLLPPRLLGLDGAAAARLAILVGGEGPDGLDDLVRVLAREQRGDGGDELVDLVGVLDADAGVGDGEGDGDDAL